MRILVRAVEMLAIGGKVVYSTCSLNPVENEAVVSQLLLRAKGKKYNWGIFVHITCLFFT